MQYLEASLFWLLLSAVVVAAVFGGMAFTGRFVGDDQVAPGVGNFTISAVPANRRVQQAQNAVYSVSVGAEDGFAGDVRLSLSGATGWFSRPRFRPPGASRLTVTTSLKTVPATYPIRILARGGKRLHWTRVMLVVTPAATEQSAAG
jgi:hypothetical protein